MAESVGLHFALVSSTVVAEWLEQRLPGGALGQWAVLSPEGYLVLVYAGDNAPDACEPDDWAYLCKSLGSVPSCAYELELCRSRGRESYDAAVALATDLLREFDGVLRDIGGETYWSLAELEAGKASEAGAELWPDT